MSTSETILLWIGVAGFALSLLHLCWDVFHYFRRLQIKIVQGMATGGVNRFLVLFDVGLWNPSSRTKSVDDWKLIRDPRLLKLWKIEQVDFRDDPNDNDKLQMVDPLGEPVGQPEFRDKFFRPTLDIESRRSENRWIPLLLTFDEVDLNSPFLEKRWRFWLYALDPSGKRVSKPYFDTTVKELTSN